MPKAKNIPSPDDTITDLDPNDTLDGFHPRLLLDYAPFLEAQNNVNFRPKMQRIASVISGALVSFVIVLGADGLAYLLMNFPGPNSRAMSDRFQASLENIRAKIPPVPPSSQTPTCSGS